jgi:hypothetical protein
MVMGVFDAKRLAQRWQQMLLIHLRIALYGFVREALRHVAKLRDGFLLQILVGHCHCYPPGNLIASNRCGGEV